MKVDTNEMQAVQAVRNAAFSKIPFSKLVLSGEYQARKGGAQASDPAMLELKASVREFGILQNLIVVDNGDGTFGVNGGGRRLCAFGLNVAEGAFSADDEIMCMVIDQAYAHLASLIENLHRQDMHPVDEFEGFQRLHDDGRSIAQIAAIFGVEQVVVRRRMRLGAIAPALRAECRADRLSLDAMMAFASVEDHALQVGAWDALAPDHLSAREIRNFLNSGKVSCASSVARFVGTDAYQAAGGRIERDLFSEDGDGMAVDPSIMSALALEKLRAVVPESSLLAQGWKWVDYAIRYSYADYESHGRVTQVVVPWSEAELNRYSELAQQLGDADTAIDEAYAAATEAGGELDEDALPPEIAALDAARNAIAAEMEALHSRDEVWMPEQQALAGCVVSVSQNSGEPFVTYGLVRPEDGKALKALQAKPTAGLNEQSVDLPSGRPVHNAALLQTLTAQRTSALAAMLTQNTHVALAQLAAQLVQRVLRDEPMYASRAVQIGAESQLSMWHSLIPDFAETRAGRMLTEVSETWTALLSETEDKEDEALFAWMLGQKLPDILEILTVCVALTTLGVQANEDQSAEHTALAQAVGLDMRDWWEASGTTYFNRVRMSRIVEVVTETRGVEVARRMAKLKKAEAIQFAEQQLKGTGWLPEVLKTGVLMDLDASPNRPRD